MNKLNALRRSLINYVVLLGVLSAMVLMMDLSGRQVQNTVEDLEVKNRQVAGVSL